MEGWQVLLIWMACGIPATIDHSIKIARNGVGTYRTDDHDMMYLRTGTRNANLGDMLTSSVLFGMLGPISLVMLIVGKIANFLTSVEFKRKER